MQLALYDERGWHYNERTDKEERLSRVAPDLSHYYGRAVVDILRGSGAEGDPTWVLVLEGGVAVQNYDEHLPIPGDHIKGQRFTNMTMGARVTSMFFGGLGGNTVSLNPMKYAIGDKAVMDAPYYPQATEQGDAKYDVYEPPPEPEGRTADGPDDDWLSEREELIAEDEPDGS
jgi:hypothetical protein